jgi:DNA polymerase-3 subunit alpha
LGTVAIADLETKANNERVRLAGIVVRVRQMRSRKGDRWAIAGLEDLSGVVDLLIFPEAFRRLESRFHTDAVLLVKGRLRAEEAGVRLAVEDAKPLEETLAESGESDAGGATVGRVVIELDPGHITTETIDRLEALFRRKPGHSPVEFRLPPEVGAQEAGRNLRVQADEELLAELKTLCGESAVSLVQ